MRAIVTASALVIIATSCSSWVESTRKSVNDEAGPRTTKKEVKWVSKGQYDDLMAKYKNLLADYDTIKKSTASTNNLAAEVAPKNESLTESVDVFAPAAVAARPKTGAKLSANEVDRELTLFKRSEALYAAGNLSDALTAFQLLQKSPTPQIRVRAERYVANIYLKNEQYDLALQVFEQIIQSSAFSAVVLDALAGAIICCEKLGLEEKRAQYHSILKDVFELG